MPFLLRLTQFDLLRLKGYIVKGSTEPTQKAVNLGVLELIERLVYTSPDTPKLRTTTKVTGKGQVYFAQKVKEWVRK